MRRGRGAPPLPCSRRAVGTLAGVRAVMRAASPCAVGPPPVVGRGHACVCCVPSAITQGGRGSWLARRRDDARAVPRRGRGIGRPRGSDECRYHLLRGHCQIHPNASDSTRKSVYMAFFFSQVKAKLELFLFLFVCFSNTIHNHVSYECLCLILCKCRKRRKSGNAKMCAAVSVPKIIQDIPNLHFAPARVVMWTTSLRVSRAFFSYA